MDRQFDPMQMESNPPITQGLQHIPTEPPAWAQTAGRVIHYLMNDFGGGRRCLKLAWVINFQKLATIPLLESLLQYFHRADMYVQLRSSDALIHQSGECAGTNGSLTPLSVVAGTGSASDSLR